jgi:antitoxin PrlF
MSTATVTSKGQVTIPVEIREQLEIKSGDQLVFGIGLDGQLRVRVRRPRVGSGRGIIPGKKTSVTRAAIGEAVAEGVARRLERSAPVTRKRARTS